MDAVPTDPVVPPSSRPPAVPPPQPAVPLVAASPQPPGTPPPATATMPPVESVKPRRRRRQPRNIVYVEELSPFLAAMIEHMDAPPKPPPPPPPNTPKRVPYRNLAYTFWMERERSRIRRGLKPRPVPEEFYGVPPAIQKALAAQSVIQESITPAPPTVPPPSSSAPMSPAG